jgi:hypothetical protein
VWDIGTYLHLKGAIEGVGSPGVSRAVVKLDLRLFGMEPILTSKVERREKDGRRVDALP